MNGQEGSPSAAIAPRAGVSFAVVELPARRMEHTRLSMAGRRRAAQGIFTLKGEMATLTLAAYTVFTSLFAISSICDKGASSL